MQDKDVDKKLYIVEGANLSLLMNDGATRRGKRLHYSEKLNDFIRVYSAYEDKEIMSWNPKVRTLCNLVVYGKDEASRHVILNEPANCKNCIKLAEQLRGGDK